jgi:opacity protein-like surface antigen
MKSLKKMAVLVIAVSFGGAVYAQDVAVGGNIGIETGSDVDASVGIGAKVQYTLPTVINLGTIQSKIRAEVGGGLYFSGWKERDLSLNAHLLIPVSSVSKLSVYPLAGLSLVTYKPELDIEFEGFSESEKANTFKPTTRAGIGMDDFYEDEEDGEFERQYRLGFNIGAGAQYEVSRNIFVQAELKYRITKAEEFEIEAGDESDSGKINMNRVLISIGVVYKF